MVEINVQCGEGRRNKAARTCIERRWHPPSAFVKKYSQRSVTLWVYFIDSAASFLRAFAKLQQVTILGPSRPSILPSTWKNPIPAKRIFREHLIMWIFREHFILWNFREHFILWIFREHFILWIFREHFIMWIFREHFILWIFREHFILSIFREHFTLWILPKAVQRIKVWLTPILLTWRIWWAPNNASRWQMGFNWAFKGLKSDKSSWYFIRRRTYLHDNFVTTVTRLRRRAIDNNRYYSIVI
jgi:hypothetical protein